MKPKSYKPPIPFERIWELVNALDSEAELSRRVRTDSATVLLDLVLTFKARKPGAPVRPTHMRAALAVQVAKRFGVSDTAAAKTVARLTKDGGDQTTIERTMRRVRSGKSLAHIVVFSDAEIDRAGARLKTGNK